ncbi:hypothetical protein PAPPERLAPAPP_02890 [Brevundimonas phage vB_BpoS-Papperlapapp]|uniref:Uncharacterized protein n=2 Tax=Marchewkavirus TaxID=3425052 RepID=A0A9E7SJT0_9CAUD|nr:hypothetical protein KABACHOK_01250 [Brevundimonas phage vB_BpoS-Kabachok]USN14659.1 hypothetical protein DOMOVOI_01850 [Brevundimonas phage vB_BpoS-Domovoi]USN16030.1 hypothetical protein PAPPERLAPAPP_02890 [Brevundimonas phage vB_BpoS-Papperlapapp]
MTSHERAGLDAIRAVLEPEGFRVDFEPAKKHNMARIIAPDGSRHKIPLIGSGRSGDFEAGVYARQQARRLLRWFQPALPYTKDDPAVFTYFVVKRNQTLSIQCVETGHTAYQVPDWLTGFVRNRQGLNALAARMTAKPVDRHHQFIAAFEAAVNPF